MLHVESAFINVTAEKAGKRITFRTNQDPILLSFRNLDLETTCFIEMCLKEQEIFESLLTAHDENAGFSMCVLPCILCHQLELHAIFHPDANT